MGNDKPGDALAERMRERSQRARDRYHDAVRKVVDDWETPTSPLIVVTRKRSDPPPSLSRLPVVGALPRRWRPYVVVVVIVGMATGAITGEDVLRWIGLVPTQSAPE